MLRALVIGLVLLAPTTAFAQISPGPLSEGHADLEGIRQCKTCHGRRGNDEMDRHCLECHGAIAWLREEGRGLHSLEGRTDCADCHPEHAGREFELIDWDGPEGFDHARAGYALTGSHAALKCEQCHRSENVARSLMLRRPEGADAPRWAGIDPSCARCHTPIHTAAIGKDCASCHSTSDFHTVENFDHRRTRYPLLGRHTAVECAKCHENGRFGTTPDRRAHLAPIRHAECGDCHHDPHENRFGPECSRCHVEDGFRIVSAARFDHDRTRYPLRGAHARVTCEKCHDENRGPNFGKKPRFARCDDCHQDPHAGRATLAGAVVDCEKCHALSGFTPSLFTVADHANSKYPLEGKHVAVDCAKCHRDQSSPKDFVFRPTSATCRDCHGPAHGTQFVSREVVEDCASCHDTQGFDRTSFDLARHGETALPLEGAHAAAECERCHAPDRRGLPVLDPTIDRGTAKVALVLAERACEDCHADPHEGRYAGGALTLPCQRCHTQSRFRPSTVDNALHDRFAMRLEGAHRATPCFLCHEGLSQPARLEPESSGLVADPPLDPPVRLWPVPTACEGCHTSKVNP